MRNNETVKFRVPTVDLEMWRGKAAVAGISLSEWIRGRCNEYSGDKWVRGEIGAELRGDLVLRAVPTKPKTVKTCTHATSKGYHCWQCGGMAKIE